MNDDQFFFNTNDDQVTYSSYGYDELIYQQQFF